MRRARTLAPALALFAAALALAPAAGAEPASGIVHVPGAEKKPLRELGASLYAANCASCHGYAGQGVSEPSDRGPGESRAQGPPLVGVGEQAPDFYLRTGRMPINHAGEEPERQRPPFSDREIRALVAYVGSFGRGPAIPEPEPRRDALSEGFSLFTEHCAGCHQIVGEGGYVPGAKVPVLQHATATQVAEAVRIGPFLMPRFSKKAISDDELDALIAYVQRSKHPRDEGGFGLGHIGPVPEGMVAWLVAAVVLVAVCMLLGRRLKT